MRVGVITFAGEVDPLTGERASETQQDAHLEIPLTGDFTAVVRVDVRAGPANRHDQKMFVGGELVAADAGGNRAGVRLSNRWFGDNAVALERFHWVDRKGGGSGVFRPADEPRPGFVRIVRAGSTVTVGGRWDGEEWTDCGPVEMPWGPTVRLGLAADNTTDARAEVTFDRYTITQPGNAP